MMCRGRHTRPAGRLKRAQTGDPCAIDFCNTLGVERDMTDRQKIDRAMFGAAALTPPLKTVGAPNEFELLRCGLDEWPRSWCKSLKAPSKARGEPTFKVRDEVRRSFMPLQSRRCQARAQCLRMSPTCRSTRVPRTLRATWRCPRSTIISLACGRRRNARLWLLEKYASIVVSLKREGCQKPANSK